MIFNYNALLIKYDHQIQYYAQMLKFGHYDDHAQEIRLYIYDNVSRFNPVQSSLKYYVRMLIITAYRKIIYDRKKQEVFEGSFSNIIDDVPCTQDLDRTDELLSRIIKKLDSEPRTVIFYAMLYNKDDKNFISIARFLNMKYGPFLKHIKQIRKITREVLKDMEKANGQI